MTLSKPSGSPVTHHPTEVGAVISHILPSGEEKPIAFTTLSKAEQNYALIKWEALGIVFRVRKFHQYLYQRCSLGFNIGGDKCLGAGSGPPQAKILNMH